MTGRFIYLCKTDKDGPDQGVYVQATRRVFPTRAEAIKRAEGASPSRKAFTVELPEPVEVDENYYPVEEPT
jgi:hypothetical protein